MTESRPQRPSNDLPVLTPVEPVPVYSCHVILSGPDADGGLQGRVTNLPGISARARSERDLLTQLVRQFQNQVRDLRTAGQEVPWNTEPQRPSDGERQRWIPVHL
ncbi:MAG: hypothetical protein ACK5Q5_13685 [Planctomycetaceae bacterium]